MKTQSSRFHFRPIFGAVLLALLTAAPAVAGLKFARTIVEKNVGFDDIQVIAEFPFINNTSAPVVIKGVRSSCGCTTYALDQEFYRPGEGGIITGTFTIGDRTGTHTKTLTVRTHDWQFTTLKIKAHISRELTLSPRFLKWKRGGSAKTQTVDIQVNHRDKRFVIGKIEVNNPAFRVETTTRKPGKKFSLKIAPVSTATKQMGQIRLIPAPESDFKKMCIVYTYIL